MNDRDVFRRQMMAIERLDEAALKQEQYAQRAFEAWQQAQAAQAELGAVRQVEEAKFKQAMVNLFQEQQQRAEMALQPKLARAWLLFIALLSLCVLVFIGWLLLLNQANQRLQAAQARADTIEVKAEVMEASRHVVVTSCGGRPCIKIDKDTPTWQGKQGDYVLVDGKSGKEIGSRR